MNIDENTKEYLLKCYKEYYRKALEVNNKSNLSEEEKNAVAQKVLDDLMDKAFLNQNIPENEHADLKDEFIKLFEKELPDLAFTTLLKFSKENGFSKK